MPCKSSAHSTSDCHASLPDGVRLIPDRSELILGSVETLTDTLIQQAIIVTIICLVFCSTRDRRSSS